MAVSPAPVTPYIVGRPITEPERFFGREDLFAFINYQLASETRIILLVGQRRIGKSSVLRQIPNFIDRQRHLVVQFDLQGYAAKPLIEVIYLIAEEVLKAIINQTGLTPTLSSSQIRENAEVFRKEFLPKVYEIIGDKRLLLLLDEFDVLGESQVAAAGNELFPYIQQLIQDQKETKLVLVAVIGRRLEEVPILLNLFREAVRYKLPFDIGRLDREETKRLITKPATGILEFEDGVIEAIYQLTAGHPYLTQLICDAIFHHVRQQDRSSVTAEDVEAAVKRAMVTGVGGLGWFYKGLSAIEGVLLAAISEIPENSKGDGVALLSSEKLFRPSDLWVILEENGITLRGIDTIEAIQRLVDWDILSLPSPGNYTVTIEMVRRWMVKQHPLARAKHDLELVDKAAVRDYEEARNAHKAGDLRRAISLYRATLLINPNHFQAQLGLAEALLEDGEFHDAVSQYHQAYLFDPYQSEYGLVRALTALGESYAVEGAAGVLVSPTAKAAAFSALLISPGDEKAQALIAHLDPESARTGWRTPLVSLLGGHDVERRFPPTAEILFSRALRDSDVRVRRAALRSPAFSKFGNSPLHFNPVVRRAVWSALADEDPQVRQLARRVVAGSEAQAKPLWLWPLAGMVTLLSALWKAPLRILALMRFFMSGR